MRRTRGSGGAARHRGRDLHAFLPPEFEQSYALGVWSEGNITYAVGYGFHSVNRWDEALLWIMSACPSNLNGDGMVDDSDFSIFAVAYNILDCADPAMPAGCPADLNHDGYVDNADFVVFLVAYNALLCP